MYGTKATFEQNNGENLPNLMKDKLQTQKMLQATHRIETISKPLTGDPEPFPS